MVCGVKKENRSHGAVSSGGGISIDAIVYTV